MRRNSSYEAGSPGIGPFPARGDFAPPQDGRGVWTVALRGQEEVLLSFAPDHLLQSRSLRLNARSARKLAAELLAHAGALDGSSGD